MNPTVQQVVDMSVSMIEAHEISHGYDLGACLIIRDAWRTLTGKRMFHMNCPANLEFKHYLERGAGLPDWWGDGGRLATAKADRINALKAWAAEYGEVVLYA